MVSNTILKRLSDEKHGYALTAAGTKIGHLTVLCTELEVELVKYC